MEFSGCRVRGPPGLPSRSPWRLQPRRDPPGASPRGAHSGRVAAGRAAASLEPGRRHGVQASGSRARVRGVSLPLLPSRKARRGHEDWQCAQGTGQQRQRLSFPSSELGSHGSGRAVRALPSEGRRPVFPGHSGVQDTGEGPARLRRGPGSLPGCRRLRRLLLLGASPGGRLAPAPPAPPRLHLAPTRAGRPSPGSPSAPAATPLGRCAPLGASHGSFSPPGYGRSRARQPPARSQAPAPCQLRLGWLPRCAAFLIEARGSAGAHACCVGSPPPRSAPPPPRRSEPFTFSAGVGVGRWCSRRLEPAREKTELQNLGFANAIPTIMIIKTNQACLL